MQIKIEIDVKPEELRRFLGLPDVAGLQEDLINFVRTKLGHATENFDPATFVRTNLETLRKSRPWRRLMDGASAGDEAEETPSSRPRRPRAPKSDD